MVYISVVVPVYNEAESVAQLQSELRASLERFAHEIIFVDDGSTDGTADRVHRDVTARVLAFTRNSGQSAAMYAGLMAARGRVLVLIDGDLQNDPADIPHLLAELERGADLVCGYRVHRKDTWFKRAQSRLANAVRSRFVGDGVQDTGCTLKAMRVDCREALVPFNGMHRFIPALVKGLGYKVVEVPVTHRPRAHGTSKYRFKDRALRATLDMFGVRWLLSRQVRIRCEPEKPFEYS